MSSRGARTWVNRTSAPLRRARQPGLTWQPSKDLPTRSASTPRFSSCVIHRRPRVDAVGARASPVSSARRVPWIIAAVLVGIVVLAWIAMRPYRVMNITCTVTRDSNSCTIDSLPASRNSPVRPR